MKMRRPPTHTVTGGGAGGGAGGGTGSGTGVVATVVQHAAPATLGDAVAVTVGYGSTVDGILAAATLAAATLAAATLATATLATATLAACGGVEEARGHRGNKVCNPALALSRLRRREVVQVGIHAEL